jgi:putative alpha-1,2-mannosidase
LKTENPFKVRTVNNSDNNIFVQTAKLNGKPLDRAFIYFKEFAAGAELVLEMGNKPSKWGTQELPPSYGPENN